MRMRLSESTNGNKQWTSASKRLTSVHLCLIHDFTQSSSCRCNSLAIASFPFQPQTFRYLSLDSPEESKLGSNAGKDPRWPLVAVFTYPLLRLPMFPPDTPFIRCIVDTHRTQKAPPLPDVVRHDALIKHSDHYFLPLLARLVEHHTKDQCRDLPSIYF